MDGGDLEEEDQQPKKVGFFSKLATKLKPVNRKTENPKIDEVELEFDKDSDEWVFEGGAFTCEICNEPMPDGRTHKCSAESEEKSSD